MASNLLNFLRDSQAQSEMRNALTDAANRGMVAGSLGAPVDMATTVANLLIAGGGYAGHKMGLLSQPPELIESRNVPGSSEWIGKKMQNAGVVSPNRNALAEFGMGLLSPVAYKGAQKAGGLLYKAETNALANLAKPSTMRMAMQRGAVPIADAPQTLYHGTISEYDGLPRDSYGGVYYAEKPQVADAYAGPDGFVKKARLGKAKIFDPSKPGSEKVLRRIESDYDNATDYKDPDDGAYMPLTDWVRSGYLFKLGRRAQNEVMESLKAEGYDAVRYKDASPMTGDSVSWVVLNPKVLHRTD